MAINIKHEYEPCESIGQHCVTCEQTVQTESQKQSNQQQQNTKIMNNSVPFWMKFLEIHSRYFLIFFTAMHFSILPLLLVNWEGKIEHTKSKTKISKQFWSVLLKYNKYLLLFWTWMVGLRCIFRPSVLWEQASLWLTFLTNSIAHELILGIHKKIILEFYFRISASEVHL